MERCEENVVAVSVYPCWTETTLSSSAAATWFAIFCLKFLLVADFRN